MGLLPLKVRQSVREWEGNTGWVESVRKLGFPTQKVFFRKQYSAYNNFMPTPYFFIPYRTSTKARGLGNLERVGGDRIEGYT